MAQKYSNLFNPNKTPQSQSIPGENMVKNQAGGYVFAVGDMVALERFVILGSASGTYYASARDITRDCAETIINLGKSQHGVDAVNKVVEISESKIAVSNSPAIFALALIAKKGTDDARKAAYAAMHKVCRIPTHLFEFVAYCDEFGGWSRGLRNAVSEWYARKTDHDLVYHLVKYKNRNGWSHLDMLRLAHPIPHEGLRGRLFAWLSGKETIFSESNPDEAYLLAAITAGTTQDENQAVRLIRDYGLTHEMVSNDVKSSPRVWEALLERMPMDAMIRNLGKMTSVGLIVPFSGASKTVRSRLEDQEYIQKSGANPFKVYVASKTYNGGHGDKGSLKWTPDASVSEALETAFRLSFNTLQPTGKRYVIGLDLSGSIWGGVCNGVNISLTDAQALMALIFASIGEQTMFIGFDTKAHDLPITKYMSMSDIVRMFRMTGGGGTDCSIPVNEITRRNVTTDGLIVITDHQTWAGSIHPVQASAQYRKTVNSQMRGVYIALTAVNHSIAGKDVLDIDVCGMNTDVPMLTQNFISM